MVGANEKFCRLRQVAAGVGLASAAALIGLSAAAAAHADHQINTLFGLGTGDNQGDPAVVAYSPDPNNVFAPVYTIAPSGAEDVFSTDAGGEVSGFQNFSISEFGFSVGSFTGKVEYRPTPFDGAAGLAGTVSQLSQELGFGSGYDEAITTFGGTGNVLPDEQTTFLIFEFGFGFGDVFEISTNSDGTSATIGDFLLTPFGDVNITPLADLFLTSGIPAVTGAIDA